MTWKERESTFDAEGKPVRSFLDGKLTNPTFHNGSVPNFSVHIPFLGGQKTENVRVSIQDRISGEDYTSRTSIHFGKKKTTCNLVW